MSFILEYALKIFLWFAITFLLLYLIRRKRLRGKRELCGLFLIAWIVAVFSVTLFPEVNLEIDAFTYMPSLQIRFRDTELSMLNIVPFKSILAAFTGGGQEVSARDQLLLALINLAGNVFLFVPLGFLLPLTAQKRSRFGVTVGVSAVLSAGIETVQYFIGRSADIDDLLLNVFGAVVGFGLYAILRKWLQRIE